MKSRVSLLLVAMALVAVVIAGCGGGGGSTESAGTTLSIYTSTVPVTDKAPSKIVMAGLDEGAAVTAYNYATGDILATGTLDANGTCDIQLTPGLTVAIVIVGTRTEGMETKAYRLSRILALVPEIDEDVVLDPVTSMAAEAIAENHPMGNGTVLSQDIVESVETAARTYADANIGADYSLGQGLFSNGNFGANGSINGTALANVMTAASATVDNNVVQAKNAVQQMKEAGVPLNHMAGDEFYDIQTMFDAVKDKYAALGDRMGDYLLAAIFGNMQLDSNYVDITELTMGHHYSMVIDGMGGRILTDLGAGTANQITITSNDTGGTYTITAVQTSTGWTFTQTYTGDAQQLYRIVVPELPEGGPGANPSLTLSLSFRDSVFTTPLTYQGTLSANGSDPANYTQIAYNGTLSSPNFSSTGRFQMNYRSSLPSNARPGSTLMSYPTGVSLSNASIAMSNNGQTIRLTGAFSLTEATVTGTDGYATTVTDSFSLRGGYTNNGTGMNFSGEISADIANPSVDMQPNTMNGTLNVSGEITREGHPAYRLEFQNELNNGGIDSTIRLQAGSSSLSGTFNGNMPSDGPPYGDIVLTNQAGVKFNVNISETHVITGTVTAGAGNTQVGTITQEAGRIRITWNTNPVTYDEL